MNKDDQMLAILVHLSGLIAMWIGGASIIGPAIFYFITTDKSPELRAQVLEALNFSITSTLSFWLLGASMALVLTIPIALPLMAIIAIAYVVLSIIGAVEANKGNLYRYPLTWRVIHS